MESKLQLHWCLALWPGFWYLVGFSSAYPLEKMIQRCLGSRSFFFLIIDDTAALDCILKGRWNLHVSVLCLDLVSQKLTVSPQMKKIPSPFPVAWISLVFPLLLPLVSLSFLWVSDSIRSSLVSYVFMSMKVCNLQASLCGFGFHVVTFNCRLRHWLGGELDLTGVVSECTRTWERAKAVEGSCTVTIMSDHGILSRRRHENERQERWCDLGVTNSTVFQLPEVHCGNTNLNYDFRPYSW